MHEASALVAGGSLLAAREIARGSGRPRGQLAGGLHHAMADRAAGFCVYNDCAVAIAWLLDQGVERIAYVDVDVHHGDGVQAAFYDDPRVLTISTAPAPAALCCRAPGWPGESGKGAGAGYAVNVPLPPGTDDAGWLRAFHAVVPVAAGGVPAADPGHPVRRRHPPRGPAGRPASSRSTGSGRSTARCASSPSALRGGVAGHRRRRVRARSGWCRGPGRTCWRRSLDRDVDPATAAAGRRGGRTPRACTRPGAADAG